MNERIPLAGKQVEVFEFVLRSARTRGHPVSLEEIALNTTVYDRSHASKIVKQLVEMGYVRQLDGHGGVELADGSGLVLPLPGLTAAGQPIENLTPEHGFFSFNDAFGGDGNFMLTVRGTSMIGECIADGDLLILQPAAEAEDGQKVVCRVEGLGLTLKIFRKIRGAFWLYAANPGVEPLRLDPKRDNAIIGVLVGVVRKER